MALRKPLVVVDGQLQQLQAGDELDAPISAAQVVSLTNEEVGSITQGMAVYSSSAGKVKKAKADAAGTAKVMGLVYDTTITADNAGEIVTDGVLTMADWTTIVGSATLTTGSIYYLSKDTAGLLTAVAPSTVGQLVIAVGTALSTIDLLVAMKNPILL